MKTLKTFPVLFILLIFSTCLRAGEPGKWWDQPYPDRFDASVLREQPAVVIDGKRFRTAGGEVFTFRGVSIGDPAKLAGQGRWDRRLFAEIRDWGANSIRLPVHPAPWRDLGADWYFSHIDDAVRWANELGMYLVIDWHSIGNLDAELFQHPMYQTSLVETSRFWRSIAYRYRDVPTVALYELFNEPTDNFIGVGSGSLGKASWDEWRDTLEDLVDLVRVYDPSALPLVAGFNWAYDLSHVDDQPIRRERIAYAVHPYPMKSVPEEKTEAAQFALWEAWGHVAERYPVVASELGWVSEDGYGAHVPVIDNEGTYGPELVKFMEDRGISWMAWCFDPDWAPTMISDWDFTPTEQGRFFRHVMRRLREGDPVDAALP